MTTRELPMEEWGRLSETEILIALPFHHPDDVRIMVVEDAGRIVGAWAVLRVVQLEGLWVAPEYRKRVSVARHLLPATLELARTLAPFWAYTGAQTPEIERLLEHIGAKPLNMTPYVVPLRELPCQSPSL